MYRTIEDALNHCYNVCRGVIYKSKNEIDPLLYINMNMK